jgi:predicted outer membrane protein
MKVGKCMLLGASALFVAGQAAAQSGIPITKDRVTTTTTTTVSPGEVTQPVASSLTVTEVTLPPFDINAYANMSEQNILAFMFGGDSLEIEMGRLAQTKGSDQRVRDYGTMLVNDHSAHLATLQKIDAEEDLDPVPMANNIEGSRMRGMLVWLQNTPAGAPWDAAFLRFQAAHHQNAIDAVSRNVKNAHDDDFEKVIDSTLESFANHRDRARTIATELGVSLP